MDKFSQLRKIKELYASGGNLMEFLRNSHQLGNDTDSIMISYDFQAGTYIKVAEQNSEYINNYTSAIQKVLAGLGDFQSIMEVGVGEATIMSNLLLKIKGYEDILKFGFDISWSRIKYAREYSRSHGLDINLFTANLFNIPLPDSSIDIVYTSHSLEPNGGKEKEALQELYRVSSKYIVLLEPSYEFASEEGKQRMTKHGYVRYLDQHAKDLSMEVIEHRLFDYSINPLNPTALTVIKVNKENTQKPGFICPTTGSPLSFVKGSLFSNESMLVYPIIDEIPCLLSQNAILAAHFNR